ncbi:MAG: O-antigen ligase family protein [Deltaproteobacteria bacterium]|nr:O-antigen ligase family protein [Deltaproteobacteria bacterium]
MSYFATLLYIILIFIRPQDWTEALEGVPILDYMAVLAVGTCFLEGNVNLAKWKRSPLNWLILVFWLTLILSQATNFYPAGVLEALEKFSKVLIVYYLIVFTVDTVPKLRMFTWLLIFMSLFLAISAVIQYYTGVGLAGAEALQRGGVTQARGVGIFADPNDLALNLVPTVAFLLPSFHRVALSNTWVTGFLALMPIITGIIYTRSRGGIMGLAAVAWMYMRKRVGLVLSVVGLLLLGALLLAIPRMDEINTGESSARSRLEHWSYGLELFRAHPLFGAGYNSFTEDYPQTAHNSFVLVLAEAGILGAAAWVALFVAGFRHLFLLSRLDRAPPWLQPYVDSLQAALVGWLVCAFFLSQTYKFLSFVLLAMVVASMNALARQGVEVHHPWTSRQLLYSGAGAVIGVLFMYAALKVLWAM